MSERERWRRVQALFHRALELESHARDGFLKQACAGEPELLATLRELLDADGRDSPLLDGDLGSVAGRMLDASDGGGRLPSTLGPYRVLSRLGEGGMGVVYLAERAELGHKVAVKVLRDASLSPARRERFFSEQRTLARLSHPSIAQLHDADTLPDGTPWFSMEYVDGLPLTEYCARHATSIPGRLLLFRSVCEAVRFAHRHAVIHRDLKPSNILVKADGSVRLLDFGIAKQLESDDESAQRTRTGLAMMTPAYAAPEQLRGEQAGMHSDVYALGVILYELLTGKLPEPEAERPSVGARRIAAALPAERPAAPSSRAAWSDLDLLCLTAMHRDVQRRYGSVEALMRDIDHFLRQEPLDARADSLRYRLRKFVGRNRQPVLAASVALLILLGVVSFYTLRLTFARNEALAEAARTQRIQRFMMQLFAGGDGEVGPADDLRVVTLVDRGLQSAKALDGTPEVQAELYLTLGSIYEQLGKLDQADSLFQLAARRRRELFGPESAEYAEVLTAHGHLRIVQARLEQAEPLVREGLAMSRRRLPADHPQLARAAATLGLLLQEQGEYDAAIEVLEQVVELQSESAEAGPELSATLGTLANSYFYAGRLEESEALNLRTLELDRKLWGERHPNVADALINLGAIRFNLGRYDEAEAYDRQALEMIEEWYGREHPETASAMTLLGRALVYQAKLEEANRLLEQALEIQHRFHGELHPLVASVVNDLAGAAVLADDLDRAESLYRRTAESARAIYGERHQRVALALANLASVDLERGEYTRAEAVFRDVVERYSEALSPEDLQTGIARIKLGRALVGQRRFAEAEAETLAGYRIVSALMDPSVSFLRSARSDLVAIYEALQEPESAARYRDEQAALDR